MAAPVLALTATTAGATTVSGQIEICKALAPTSLAIDTTATFTFTTNATGETVYDVAAGSCSGAINVSSSGTVVITETGFLDPTTQAFVALPGTPGSMSTFVVTSITELPGQTYLTTPTKASLAAYQATVTIAAGQVDEVTYTNALQTGYIEVCKQPAAGSGLTGAYTFGLAGQDGFAASTTDTIIGTQESCSLPIQVPAGNVTVTEAGSNLYVTGISATVNGIGNAIVGTANLVTGTVTVGVGASADTSVQTDVTYTDNVVSLKVCKEFDGVDPNGASQLFPFTETVGTGAVPGPDTAPTGFSLLAGAVGSPVCSNPVAYRPGTSVTITEGPVAGTKVENIYLGALPGTPPGQLPGASTTSSSTHNGTTTIVVGNPTSGSATTDEAIVTFEDQPAAGGQLKICKLGSTVAGVGPNVPTSGVFSFTISAPATTAVPAPPALATATVQLNKCVIVSDPLTQTATSVGLWPFNDNLMVTETGTPTNVASGITVVPMFVLEDVNGVETPTTTLSESNVNLGVIGGNASADTLISEGATTEVDVTNIDPPVVVTGPGGVTVVDPGGPSAGTTTAPTLPLATSIAATIPALLATPNGAASNLSSATIAKSLVLTSAQRKALLNKDNKTLGNVKAAITKWTATAAHTKGLLHKTAESRLAQLKTEAKILNSEIKLLKK